MTNAPPKKRPWFQLHLSTCVVLMVVAGILAYLNFMPRATFASSKHSYYGWPAIAYEPYFEEINFPTLDEIPENWIIEHKYRWLSNGVLLDGAIAMFLLGTTARYCEMWIRRRERARAGSVPGPDTTHAE